MKILNIGSLNIDRFYKVEDFVRQGQTIAAQEMHTSLGGKGYNQSLALARAGAMVYHAGLIGADGAALAESLKAAGADAALVRVVQGPSGHAMIQLDPKGQNCIIVYGGANHQLDEAFVDEALAGFGRGDILLLQNETTCVAYAMRAAKERGMQVVFNPSPLGKEVLGYPLELVDLFVLNEHEAEALTGLTSGSYTQRLDALQQTYPQARFVMTVGRDGAFYRDAGKTVSHGIYDVPVVDTTGAGDTFCGYFLACSMRGMDVTGALEYASLACGYAVGKMGAGPSIPTWRQVERFKARFKAAAK